MLIVVCCKAWSEDPRRPIIDQCTSSHAVYCLRLPLFHLLLHHHYHVSFPHDMPSRTTRHNDPFGVEAAEPTASIPMGMLFLTSLGRHHQFAGTLPYVLQSSAQPTRTPQRPLTRRDLNGPRGRQGAPLPAMPHKA